jgi:hypothetical protein
MKIKQIPKTDLDYVEIYAEELKKNPEFFKQQKELIDSQLIASSELSKKRFSGKNFKEKVRAYLRSLKIIR